jgi:hypothetical protein
MKEIIQHYPEITIELLQTCLGGIKYYKGIDGIFKGKLDANKTKLLYSIKSILLVAKKQFMEYNAYITHKSSQITLQKHSKRAVNKSHDDVHIKRPLIVMPIRRKSCNCKVSFLLDMRG